MSDDNRPQFMVMDVTLRDGGFCCDFNWLYHDAQALVQGLAKLPVNYIEIGYVGGIPGEHGRSSVGPFAALKGTQIVGLKDQVRVDQRIVVMVHPGALSEILAYADLRRQGVDLVRFVYHNSWKVKLVGEVKKAKDSGLAVSINIALLSMYEPGQLRDLLGELSCLGPDLIYLADTIGGLLPSDVAEVVKQALYRAPTPIGFHGHNALGSALLNGMRAVQEGAMIVDASVNGVGRGGGNMGLESWLMLEVRKLKSVSVNTLRGLLLCRQVVSKYQAVGSIRSLIVGSFNIPPPKEEMIAAREREIGCDVLSLLLQHPEEIADVFTLSNGTVVLSP